MIDITALRRFVAEGLDVMRSEVVDAEVFAVWNEQLIARLNYTSDIPCRGEYRRIHGMSWYPPWQPSLGMCRDLKQRDVSIGCIDGWHVRNPVPSHTRQ